MNLLRRMLEVPLHRAASSMPVVIVTGARQTGKSTLVRDLEPGGRTYVTLDDLDAQDQASRRPDELLAQGSRLTLDEVQRSPDLLLAVKRAVDRERTAGQFVLTGSANLLLMQRVSESLAGRAAYLTLWPLTRREQLGMGSAGLWSELLSEPDQRWPELIAGDGAPDEDWRVVARRGGYPAPALGMDADTRAGWFDGYVRTYLERDLQSISSIGALPDFRRLMRMGALRIGQLVNQTELGRDAGIPQPTVHRYLNLLEASYQVVRLQPYSVNRTKRLIKAPKLYWCDVALAMQLAGEEEARGAHLENLVLNDLIAWRDAQLVRPEVLYWRTASGAEVDFVIESRGALLPVEVKATSQPRLDDARHLRAFREEYGDAARAGLLLHTGDRTGWLSPGIFAAPWWSVV